VLNKEISWFDGIELVLQHTPLAVSVAPLFEVILLLIVAEYPVISEEVVVAKEATSGSRVVKDN
jgi:hypothetical protein